MTTTAAVALVLLGEAEGVSVNGNLHRIRGHGIDRCRRIAPRLEPYHAQRRGKRKHQKRCGDRTEPARQQRWNVRLRRHACADLRRQPRPEHVTARFEPERTRILAQAIEKLVVTHASLRTNPRAVLAAWRGPATDVNGPSLRSARSCRRSPRGRNVLPDTVAPRYAASRAVIRSPRRSAAPAHCSRPADRRGLHARPDGHR